MPGTVHLYADLAALSAAAADLCLAAAQGNARLHGRFTIALSGGSTPRALFRLLAQDPYRAAWPWAQTHVFWVDERCVPPDDPESNFGAAQAEWLAHVPLPAAQVHRMPGELPAAEGAEAYERDLRLFFGAAHWPRVDLVLLGMGDDGHTASLFPGSPALEERRRWVAPNRVARLAAERLTLTLPVLNHAARAAFLVSGAAKSAVLRAVLAGDTRYPAARVAPEGALDWFADHEAYKDHA